MLFGRPGRLAAGPHVLGARLSVPMLVGVLKPRTKGTFVLVVEAVRSDAPDAIGRALERAVRASPEQWLWMGDPLGLAGQS
jgi:lauroyl/myristoyl acyltransferase